ncbi:MAG: ABC transporter substrate-binding protein [Desulfurispora sp.]|uniref:ABC transporter substrate-binding protein n=1 Tax=Desulfurispora sp. TaxID=3014275 RepID=UPI00404B3B71
MFKKFQVGYSKLLPLVLLLSLFALLYAGASWTDSSKQELIIGLGRDFYEGPESTHFVHGSTGLWEGLTYIDDNLRPVPWLAEKLTPDKSNQTWTVTLRPGIKFHDGTPLNSAAVVKSVQRMAINPKFDEYGTFLNLKSVRAVDDRTVQFVFKVPEPAFPAKVAYHGCSIYSPNSFDSSGKFTQPYGTGPFKFAQYKKGESLTLVANKDYWGEKPRLAKVTFKYIPDPTTRLAALQSGQIHAIIDVGGIMPEQAALVKKNSKLQLYEQVVNTSHYIVFNTRQAPFNTPEMRRAVSLSLNRAQIVQKLLYGYGKPADTLFSPLAKDWTVTGLWPYNKTEAQKLSKAARVPADKRSVTILVNSALANRWPYKALAEVLQQELKTFGLSPQIKMMEMAAWKEAIKKGNYNLTIHPYTLMTGDPDFFIGRWLSSNGQMNQERGMGYKNTRVDNMIQEAAAQGNATKRRQLYQEIQKIAAQDAPIIPVYHDVCLYATRKEVKELRLDSLFKPSLARAYIQ